MADGDGNYYLINLSAFRIAIEADGIFILNSSLRESEREKRFLKSFVLRTGKLKLLATSSSGPRINDYNDNVSLMLMCFLVVSASDFTWGPTE